MKRILNFNSRVNIEPFFVDARIVALETGFELQISWHLETLDLPSSSHLVIEVDDVKSTRTKRFEYGQLSKFSDSANIDITQFSTLSSLRLRLKVSNNDSHGRRRLIASVDKLRPVLPPQLAAGFSILNIDFADLDIPWEIRFEEGEPVFFLSTKGNLYDQLRNSSAAPWFFPTIVVEIARQIFEWLCQNNELGSSVIARQWEEIFITYGLSEHFLVELDSLVDESTREHKIATELKKISDNFSKKHKVLEELCYLSALEESQL